MSQSLSSAANGIKTLEDGAVLEVTIDRPKANAIDLAASRGLNEVFTSFRDAAHLRIAIITGAGERFFCPGWDLKAAAAGEKVVTLDGVERVLGARPIVPGDDRRDCLICDAEDVPLGIGG